VGKKGPDSKTLVCLPLTGANTVPLRHGPSASSSKFMENLNFKFAINSGRVSVFKRINSKINVGSNCSTVPCIQAGVLGPILNPKRILSGYGPPLLLCSKCLSPTHSWSSCNSYTRCRRCLCFGHVSGACIILPHSSRSIPANSWGHRSTESLNEGPARQVTPRIYRTFADYIKESSRKHSIPTPVIVPWSLSWRLQAPEFDEDDEPPPVVPAITPSAVSSINRPSLGESDYIRLGVFHSTIKTHVSWALKTPTSATVATELPAMAYRFVDPTPFMPPWGQRVIVPGHPAMHRVVTGRI